MVRKVQLKGRWTIDRNYEGCDLWMAFPVDGVWCLMPHDEMLTFAGLHTKALESASWAKGGACSWPKPSKAIITHCAPYRPAFIAGVAAQAANADVT